MTSKFGGENSRKVKNLWFWITTPYPSNDLQIWKSKLQKSEEFAIWDHHSLPFKWPPNLEVKTPEKWRICNFGSPLPTLQMTSKFGGQNSREVTNLQFWITTPYPSNDFQIWGWKLQKSEEFVILDHHSLPFKWPPNLEVKTSEKWRICNFGSPLPTLQMTSKFGGLWRRPAKEMGAQPGRWLVQKFHPMVLFSLAVGWPTHPALIYTN